MGSTSQTSFEPGHPGELTEEPVRGDGVLYLVTEATLPGALGYHECVADDVAYGRQTSFPQGVKLKKGEEVWFSWIVYKSRKDRDRINAKAMRDPRLANMMDPKAMPFDGKRMVFGGFKMLVDL